MTHHEGHGQQRIPSPVQVWKFLPGIDYPSHKRTLAEATRREGADQKVLPALDRLPETMSNSPNGVLEQMGKLMEPAYRSRALRRGCSSGLRLFAVCTSLPDRRCTVTGSTGAVRHIDRGVAVSPQAFRSLINWRLSLAAAALQDLVG